MGGQTALNLAVSLADSGALDRLGVRLIGASLPAIRAAEDRQLFKQAMDRIGLKTPPSGIGTTLEECISIAEDIGEFPLIVRPAFTLGGTGGGIAYNRAEFEDICRAGLAASHTQQVLVEKSLLGWKEYELEVMRDMADNVVIICSIENIDPMGVHTGDSITVAPAQTLTDKEYQRLRDYSVAIIREIGVECGGSNVQFAVNPADGEVMVIEMNPRVSRSSALASKATGFPIAKMAAKLSVGYTLDQIPNDITKKTPASFEPSIDYVVTKIPRFAFEKFPGSEPVLTTQMKSVGEAMALGRTFQESFQKAVRSLETGFAGWGCAPIKELDWDWEKLKYSLRVPNPDRIHAIYAAFKKGMRIQDIHEISFIDKWFLTELKELVDVEQFLISRGLDQLSKDDFYQVKRRGFSDTQIAFATSSSETDVRLRRLALEVAPTYKRVDTCAAEFEANTPYMYSSYEYECESVPTNKKKVLILGGGPNRIGQGIEFDYCCCHASFALREAGYETIMMNSNPETVSTDYDTSDRLYFEPLTVEDVTNVIDLERPDGIIVQFGGQTPLKLALPIQQYLEDKKLAGIHSGDSGCSLPTRTVSAKCLDIIRSWTTKLAKRLNVCGLMNCQYAITTSGEVFLLEANPRASRTVPFVSKAIGHPLAKYASLVMSGVTLPELGYTQEVVPKHVSVKEAVLPFEKFQGCDILLGPEMRSTGEVMGIDYEFSGAFAKAQIAAGQKLPLNGTVFLSLNDLTKRHLAEIGRGFRELGFNIIATSGTAKVLQLEGIPVEPVLKIHEGRPNARDMLKNGQIQVMVITSSGDALDSKDGLQLRRLALAYKVPIITTVDGARATIDAIKSLKNKSIETLALQDYFQTTDASQNLQAAQSAS
ncbi:hypothetical protein OsI_02498 [Oryza sativa Indica Group]|uniref:Uncharacterized protein n=1 Tax=Oryza sativa subsp. indica TaxID=39946 RepID=B8AAD1_ORYSI|nr:hypothetical protein OsI_02498 [Oryza sativa Indica Group]